MDSVDKDYEMLEYFFRLLKTIVINCDFVVVGLSLKRREKNLCLTECRITSNFLVEIVVGELVKVLLANKKRIVGMRIIDELNKIFPQGSDSFR